MNCSCGALQLHQAFPHEKDCLVFITPQNSRWVTKSDKEYHLVYESKIIAIVLQRDRRTYDGEWVILSDYTTITTNFAFLNSEEAIKKVEQVFGLFK